MRSVKSDRRWKISDIKIVLASWPHPNYCGERAEVTTSASLHVASQLCIRYPRCSQEPQSRRYVPPLPSLPQGGSLVTISTGLPRSKPYHSPPPNLRKCHPTVSHTNASSSAIRWHTRCNWKGCRLLAGCIVHERNTGDAAVWVLKSQYTDIGHAGCGSGEIYTIQCVRG